MVINIYGTEQIQIESIPQTQSMKLAVSIQLKDSILIMQVLF